MQLLRASAHRRMPWKNGGGVTTEIAIFPAGAGLDDFEWRLSMATVAAAGSFSLFAGVDRTLAILEGEGLVLSIDGRPDTQIMRMSTPVSFAADRPSSARLIAGPVTDLNAMTRRGAWTHRVERLVVAAAAAITGEGGLTIIVCASGLPIVSNGSESATLWPQDAAMTDAVRLDIANGPAELYVVRLGPFG